MTKAPLWVETPYKKQVKDSSATSNVTNGPRKFTLWLVYTIKNTPVSMLTLNLCCIKFSNSFKVYKWEEFLNFSCFFIEYIWQWTTGRNNSFIKACMIFIVNYFASDSYESKIDRHNSLFKIFKTPKKFIDQISYDNCTQKWIHREISATYFIVVRILRSKFGVSAAVSVY